MRSSLITVPVQRNGNAELDWVAVEEPLEIRVNGTSTAITMRTPGHDEELAAGFLFGEGIVRAPAQIAAIETAENSVDVKLAAPVDLDKLERHFYMSSSCGVCGKASIDAIEVSGCEVNRGGPRIDFATVCSLPQKLRARQDGFERTGGLHAAALFDAAGELLDLREDVGRHNALDKLIGAAFLRGALPLDRAVLLVSGRASFELVQKAAMGGIGVMAAVGAPSSLAVETALRFGMTLCGFVRDQRFNVYSGEGRIGSA